MVGQGLSLDTHTDHNRVFQYRHSPFASCSVFSSKPPQCSSHITPSLPILSLPGSQPLWPRLSPQASDSHFSAYAGWTGLRLISHIHPLRQEVLMPISQIRKLKTVTRQTTEAAARALILMGQNGITHQSTLKTHCWDFPGGAVVENLPASAGDTGSSPGLGRYHMPRSN